MEQNPSDALTDMARNGQFENIFETPVFSHLLQDAQKLNAELRQLILKREKIEQSVTRSNQGGWQSAPDFFRWKAPPVAALERHIGHAVNIATLHVTRQPKLNFQMELYGWATVNRSGHYNSVHVHPMATWSGVYYVDPGDENMESQSGVLEFVHPVAASVMTFFPNVLPSARLVQPKEGMLIMFPSYLQHSVRLYRGEKPRISIPFNAHLRLAQ